jgi:hypothetical protein
MEQDKLFRDKYFHGKDRELLAAGHFEEIDLGDISEHDIGGRIRQGYLAELHGDIQTARQIYASIGFTERLGDEVDDNDRFDDDNEGPLLDEEVEHYTE